MKSILPHNLSFKSASKTVPLHLKIETSVFVILREILLEFSYFERDLRSLFTYFIISFIVFLIFNKQGISESESFMSSLLQS